MSDIFIATCYRWGWYNSSKYTLLVTTNEHHAISAAQAECASRGGKYGCLVERWKDGDGDCSGEQVAYFPSSYGEKVPHINRRIEIAERVGIEVLSQLDSDDGYTIPRWLREKVANEQKMSAVMEKALTAANAAR